MSILIKGMDKPTDCGVCPFEDFGYCSVKGERNTSEVGIDDDCPLIEIAEQTEPQTENGIGCSKCEGRFDCIDRDLPHAIRCNNYGKVTDCAWK